MRARLQFSRPRRIVAAAASASAVVTAVGLAAMPAAHSAPVTPGPCPTPASVAGLQPDDPVTGLTVLKGQDATEFSGSVVGVLEDGIAPGVDMVLVDLSDPTIAKYGVWSGMSGSPIYDANHKLIGAVSYSLGLGPSTIAGVTPASQMPLLKDSTTSRTAVAPTRVPLTRSLRTAVAQADPAAADSSTMRQLRVPLTLSGLSAQRVKALAPALNGRSPKGTRMHVVDTAGAPASQTPIPVDEAGDNLAAALSYGTITMGGVGTATAVCDKGVVGFGHPMTFSGPTSMSLHGADATHIQDDQTLSGFKVANLGAPVGTIDNDRLTGISGVNNALPATYPVTSHAADTAGSFDASSHVPFLGVMPDVAFSSIIAAQDKVLDRIGEGTASTQWTIKGERRDGSPFTYHRTNLYADSYDISASTAYGLVMDVFAILDNPDEKVSITSVDTSTTRMSQDYRRYVISKVQMRRGGSWVTLNRRVPSVVKAGKPVSLRVTATSREADPITFPMSLTVPSRAAGRMGSLSLFGGNYGDYDSEDFFFFGDDAFYQEQAPNAANFPKLLKAMEAAPQNNEVQASLRFRGAPGSAGQAKKDSTKIDSVIGGYKRYRLFAR